MVTDIVPRPGVIAEADVERPIPEPTDCLPSGEEPTATASLSPGWVAVTDREILVFYPDSDPALVRVERANATGVVVRRAGGRALLKRAPAAFLYALVASVFGALLLAVSPGGLIGSVAAESAARLRGWLGG